MGRFWIALLLAAAARGEEFHLHAYHATKLAMECGACHTPAEKGSVTLLRPGHSRCVTCHAMAFRTANNPRICQQCHTSPAPTGAADLMPFPRFEGQRPLLSDFSHSRHVDSRRRIDSHTGFRADCAHCHKPEGDGKRVAIPRHAECAACHGREEIRPRLTSSSTARDCRGCHTPEEIENLPAPRLVVDVRPQIEFSHRIHFLTTKQERLDCVTCHSTVPASASRATLRLPGMLECVGCHETEHRLDAQLRMSNCGLCHRDRTSGLLPASHNSNVRPASHNGGFRVHHGEQASAGDAKCFACHGSLAAQGMAGNGCVSCHQAMRPASHTPRWRDEIHGRYAALDRVNCATCHTADYCSRCHSELPRTHVPLALFKNGAHGRLAQLDRRACLTCHTFESTCASCHRRN